VSWSWRFESSPRYQVAPIGAGNHKYMAWTVEKRREWQREWRRKNPDRIKGYNQRARARQVVWARADRKKNPAKYEAYKYKARYGITRADYLVLLDAQHGGCVVCGRIPKNGQRLVTDHDHGTGKIRGLLCHDCNLTEGKYKGHPEWLERMAAYIRENGFHGMGGVYSENPKRVWDVHS